MSFKKSVLVLGVLTALYGCNNDDNTDTSNSTQNGSQEVVTGEEKPGAGTDQEVGIDYTGRILGEKDGSLQLVEEENGIALHGLTDGQHVWAYEPNIPANLTLAETTFDVDAWFEGSIEYQVNIYLMIDGVSHKADIMVNRQDRMADANVILYIDNLDPVENEDPKHTWIRTAEFENFEALKEAYGHAIVQDQAHHYDHQDGTVEAISGNFFLKFGNHDYAGSDELFVIYKWNFSVDADANNGGNAGTGNGSDNSVGPKGCEMTMTEDQIVGGEYPVIAENGDLVGATAGNFVWGHETGFTGQTLSQTEFCGDANFNDKHYVNVYFDNAGEEYKADIIMHLPGSPIAVFKDAGTDGQSKWEKIGEDFASWDALQAAYPNGVIEEKEFSYEGTPVYGNFFLVFGEEGYTGSEEYRVNSWMVTDNGSEEITVDNMPVDPTVENMPALPEAEQMPVK